MVKFLANVPVQVALEYGKGREVAGTRGEPRVMFTLIDGRKMFVDPCVAEKIDALGVGRGESFVMCKTQTAVRGGASIEWEVYRRGADTSGPRTTETQRAPVRFGSGPAGGEKSLDAAHMNARATSEDPEMVRMLKSAIAAVQAAEKCLSIALAVIK
jgi:hypothetical protein